MYAMRNKKPIKRERWRESKDTLLGMEKLKLSLFAADKIVYIENPMEGTKKLLDLSKFSKDTIGN